MTAAGTGVYYVPEYLARELGYFADEGLTIETEAPGGTWLAGQLSSGGAEIALGGVWRPLMYRGRLGAYLSFAQLTIRNPQVLVGRTPAERFQWTDLYGKSVIIPTGAPSPWMFMTALLGEAGVDNRRIKFIRDLQQQETTPLFRAGLGDYYLVMPPLSEELEAEGYHIVADMAATGGDVPWSVYYATPEVLNRPDQPAVQFARAIQRALEFVLTQDPQSMIEALRRHYPTTDPALLTRAIAGERRRGVWPKSIRISEPALQRWQRMMVDYGMIERVFPYGDVVDTRVADAVESGRPTGR
ncbi:MAG: ABC transporter substrate-binding protein [Chloroflexi bacterium]|nr:ABC transporter substrate-binding protein [Chloroflexota bacterium]